MTYIDEMVKELCPDGVEWKELGEVAEIGTGKNNTNEQVEDGKYPFYVRSKDIKRINSYLFDEEAVIIPGEGGIGEIFHYVNGKYGLHQRAYRIHVVDDRVDTRFIYYFLQTSFKQFILKKAVSATVSSIRKPMIEKFLIPIPPLEIQQEIVKILDKFTEYVTELTAELTAELTLRQQQYSFYRDKLLSFDEDSSGGTNNKVYTVQWKMLGEVADFNYGYTDKAQDFGEVRFIRITDIDENGYLKMTDKKFVSLTNESQKYMVNYGDLLMARTGATYGKTLFIDSDEPSVYASFLIKITPKESLNSRYYWHFSKSDLYWNQANNLVSKAGQPQFNANSLKKVKIPVPPLDIQSRIVQVLDNFDTVCNDLSIGLPKEIELRQKQYEFFRDKLLTFTAEGVYTDSTVQYSTVQYSTDKT
ncbi:restriction endonuclease subunit S [Streptococcus ruminantium]|uniref:restriction endonuclease subunit S n=1 Tax=Streptococcus ruminantium TaxID=1917441 RepID=UPI0012DF9C6A|nr:restriction endonuclease subunit S [Streptococcus ruminantium]